MGKFHLYLNLFLIPGFTQYFNDFGLYLPNDDTTDRNLFSWYIHIKLLNIRINPREKQLVPIAKVLAVLNIESVYRNMALRRQMR